MRYSKIHHRRVKADRIYIRRSYSGSRSKPAWFFRQKAAKTAVYTLTHREDKEDGTKWLWPCVPRKSAIILRQRTRSSAPSASTAGIGIVEPFCIGAGSYLHPCTIFFFLYFLVYSVRKQTIWTPKVKSSVVIFCPYTHLSAGARPVYQNFF